ncbi:hypothetical protein WJX84_005890 [Apatococcus fuscideae]|uniref:SUMO-conjugating enzyme UBC9 n=1 Tax=Apatococcus fuscideae TaxID=2026836 RepID=A0AAW1TGK3_9CHLO
MVLGVAKSRLAVERSNWRKDRPFGFVAKPANAPNGEVDLFTWHCKIPGPAGTCWEGGLFPLDMTFTENYPTAPPCCYFPAKFYHPNVYPTGLVCLSILNAEKSWKPGMTVKQVLLGIQELLKEPNNGDPAQQDAWEDIDMNPREYERKVKLQAQRYKA